MRTLAPIVSTPIYTRCEICLLPDSMHTQEQQIKCNKRLLVSIDKGWPKSLRSREERIRDESKKMLAAVNALSRVIQSVHLPDEDRAKLYTALDALGVQIKKRGAL